MPNSHGAASTPPSPSPPLSLSGASHAPQRKSIQFAKLVSTTPPQQSEGAGTDGRRLSVQVPDRSTTPDADRSQASTPDSASSGPRTPATPPPRGASISFNEGSASQSVRSESPRSRQDFTGSRGHSPGSRGHSTGPRDVSPGSERRLFSRVPSPAPDLAFQRGISPDAGGRRGTSPPPPSTYEKGVSFDTWTKHGSVGSSFTLRANHKHYNYTRHSRTFLCGIAENHYSEHALEWVLNELADDGDTIVCLRVIKLDDKINSDKAIEKKKYRKETQEMMARIQAKVKSKERSISLVVELTVGKVQDTIQRMVSVYEPSCLIVGTRGRSLHGVQGSIGLMTDSVSKYCLQNSPVPVIVVRPTSKRDKKKAKRAEDPERRVYADILAKSGPAGMKMLEEIEADRRAMESDPAARESEALAAAQEMGFGLAPTANILEENSKVGPGFNPAGDVESQILGAAAQPVISSFNRPAGTARGSADPITQVLGGMTIPELNLQRPSVSTRGGREGGHSRQSSSMGGNKLDK